MFAADFLGDSNLHDAQLLTRGGGSATLDSAGLGGRVIATCGGAAVPGLGPCWVMVRPESLVLAPAGSADEAGWNAVAGVVRNVIFTGNITRTTVETPSGALLTVAGLTEEAGLSLAPGSATQVRWRAEHTVLLPVSA